MIDGSSSLDSSVTTRRAPAPSQLPTTAPSPKTWTYGSAPSTVVSGSTTPVNWAWRDLGQQSPMREHRELRFAGGAGGRQQHGERFGIRRRDHGTVPVPGEFLQSGRRQRMVRPAEHQLHPDLTDQLAQVVRRKIGVERNGHQTGPQDGEVADDELDRVGSAQPHALPGHQPAVGEPGRHRVDLSVQLGPAEAAAIRPGLDQSFGRPTLGCVAVHQLREVAHHIAP